ncbi:hypothetical protein QNI19_02680 [Cytophagaceae bacterium DM2B3-1]|uniref:Uncharacterized protein n=1 Tax=Xanthocytophaga flava TaxID=3048013 RepID=A0ABT7CDL1_9BACT|nr:hypothetical protein [Xanthocytophaga flavus]MDJ1491820.1 hypothetical protein [Xanthocytophaga flavus]
MPTDAVRIYPELCLMNPIGRVGNVGEHMGSPLQYPILTDRVWYQSETVIS